MLHIKWTQIKREKEEGNKLTWSEDSSSPPSTNSRTQQAPHEQPLKCVASKGAHTKAKRTMARCEPWVHGYFALGASLGKYLKL